MGIFKDWLVSRFNSRKTKRLNDAIEMIESSGLTVAEIATKAGTDYIRASDGSLRKIGGKK